MFNFSNIENILNEYFNKKDIFTIVKLTKGQAKSGISMPIEISRKVTNKYNSNVIKNSLEIIEVPKNTKHNALIKLKEKGNQCSDNTGNGDLYVKIKIFGKT